jgi:hypothetical protein
MKFLLDKHHEYEDSIHVEAITDEGVIAFQFYMTREEFELFRDQAYAWFEEREPDVSAALDSLED